MRAMTANVLRVLLAAVLPTFATTAPADIVGASFSGTASVVYENIGGVPISSTDVLHGHLVIDTSQATRTNPGAR